MLKIIRKSNLTYRFYTHDGWTRQDVADLLRSKNINVVIPRYYEMDRDEWISTSMVRFSLPETFANRDFSDCDYFAVHALHEEFTDLHSSHAVIEPSWLY
ncbi:hypothetical protein AB4254_12235 [Vibrio breoganii]